MAGSRIGIDILADARGFIEGLKKSGQATHTLGVDLDKLSVKVKTNAEATVSATVRKQARLREEIVTYRQIARAAEKGSREQVSAANLATQAEGRLARSLGVTAHEASRLNLTGAGRDLNRVARGGVVASGAFQHLGRSVAFASGWFLGGVGFVGAVKKSISEASSLQAQMRRTTEVFRASGGEVQRWSASSAKNLGLSSAAALEAADTIGTLLKNVGQAPAKAAAMSEQFTKLAVDMAAFKKVAPEVALNALEAALTGRTRSLKQFGLVIDATAIKAEALRDGILRSTGASPQRVGDATDRVAVAQAKQQFAVKRYGPNSVQAVSATISLHTAQRALEKTLAGTTGQLTAQQKALATYNLILRQTKDQHGAFGRSSSELAHKEQVFRAALANTEAAIGTALLPTVSKYVGELGDWLSKSQNQAKVTHDVQVAVKGLTTGVHIAGAVAHEAVGGFKELSVALGGDKHAVEALGAAFVTWKLASKFATLGGESATTATKVGILTSHLKALAGIGVITLGVELIIHRQSVDKAVAGWLDKHGLGAISGSGNKIEFPKGTTDLSGAIAAAKAAHDDFLVSALQKAQKHIDARKPGAGSGSTSAATEASAKSHAGIAKSSAEAAASTAAGASAEKKPAGHTTRKVTIPAKAAKELSFTLPASLELEQARASATQTMRDDLKAARDIQAFIRRALNSGKLTVKQQTEAWNQLASANQQIASLTKQAKQNFSVPLKLQLAAAKANTTATDKDDIRIAKDTKMWTLKALKSGKLGMQAQIDAWNEIASLNATIGQKLKNTGHSVVASAEKLTANIAGLSGAARREQEARISQALAHGGHIPTGHAVAGQTIDLHSHIYLDGKKVAEVVTPHQQRAGSHSAVQVRGPHAGRNARVH